MRKPRQISSKTCDNPTCGREFLTKRPEQKYCSHKCRAEHVNHIKATTPQSIGRRRGYQPCWDCAKATGFCDWSSELKPIKGWDAVKVLRKGNDGETYRIFYCPEFERG